MTELNPRRLALKPIFETAIGEVQAGTVFPMQLPDGPAVLVTCLHLLGPAGGVRPQVPAAELPSFVRGVQLRDLMTDEVVARAGAPLLLTDADAEDPARDVAAFVLPEGHGLPLLQPCTTEPRKKEPVRLAGRVREGAPREQLWHTAVYMGSGDDGTWGVFYDQRGLVLGGTSGAAVLVGDEVLGSHV